MRKGVLVVMAAAVGLAWATGAWAQGAPIAFSRLVIKLEPGTEWGRFGFGLICGNAERLIWQGGRDEVDPLLFEAPFKRAVAAGGFSAEGGDDLFGEPEAKGEFMVGGVVTAMTGRFCAPGNPWLAALAASGGHSVPRIKADVVKGEGSMRIEWQIYSRLERKVVARITTNAQFEQSKAVGGGYQKILVGAFEENARRLVADAEFHKVFSAPPRSAAAALTPSSQPAIILAGSLGAGQRKVSESVGAVALILTGEGHGSGFLVSSDGHLITNEHVVGAAKFVKVRWSDGRETLGEVIRTDRRRDIALIKTDSGGRQPLPLRSAPPEPGEPVFAIGAPLQTEFQGTVTRGIVSATREMDGLRYVQSDVTVNPGNSGGPLIDEHGAVVAVTDLGMVKDGAPTNINLFIPIGDALTYLSARPG